MIAVFIMRYVHKLQLFKVNEVKLGRIVSSIYVRQIRVFSVTNK